MPRSFPTRLAAIAATATFASSVVAGDPEVILSGLDLPIGLDQVCPGQVWMSELGVPASPKAPGQGRISLVSREAGGWTAIPFITDMAVAFNSMGEPSGTHHVSLGSEGTLYVATGGPNIPAYPYLGSVLKYNIAFGSVAGGPYPTDGPALIEQIPIFPYVIASGFGDSNVFSVAEVGSELWVVDSGANAVIRVAADGTLSVLATLPNIVNPEGTVPPVSQAVPTRILPDGVGGAVLVQLSGYPFVPGNASVYRLAGDGTLTTMASGLTTLVDAAIAEDGSVLALSIGNFDLTTGQPAPNTGVLYRVRQNGTFEPLLENLNVPTAVEIVGEDIWTTEFILGRIVRHADAAPERCPGDLNGDGLVGPDDLTLLLSMWGLCP
ncbi:MAG: ScyD/ScyE family protein [Phycisphaerales bacterium]|jgi:hypothetical protein